MQSKHESYCGAVVKSGDTRERGHGFESYGTQRRKKNSELG